MYSCVTARTLLYSNTTDCQAQNEVNTLAIPDQVSHRAVKCVRAGSEVRCRRAELWRGAHFIEAEKTNRWTQLCQNLQPIGKSAKRAEQSQIIYV